MKLSFESPVGPITMEERNGALVRLSFSDEGGSGGSELLLRARDEVLEYLEGERRVFDIPVSPEGTEYQRRVWKATMDIPYGEVRSYKWVAERAGGSPRSAGNALGANPLPIFIPCHRVIASDGSMGGYTPGKRIKAILLNIERLHLDESVLK